MDKKNDLNYYNVRNAAWIFLINNEVSEYPLNLRKLADKNNWLIANYTIYCNGNLKHIEEIKKRYQNGFYVKDIKGNISIYYNEDNNRWRNRFTICHEIGHIMLHQYFHGEKLEQEANMFAARILMPMVLIRELNIKTPEKLSKLCDVSIEAATFRLQRYNEIKVRNKFYTNEYEQKLLQQLMPFINKTKEK